MTVFVKWRRAVTWKGVISLRW